MCVCVNWPPEVWNSRFLPPKALFTRVLESVLQAPSPTIPPPNLPASAVGLSPNRHRSGSYL